MRTVGEDVAEVAVRTGRAHLDSGRGQLVISSGFQSFVVDRLGEAGPACAAVVLIVRGKERLPGDDVDVNPGLVVRPVFVVL